jgi:hypothetical protein
MRHGRPDTPVQTEPAGFVCRAGSLGSRERHAIYSVCSLMFEGLRLLLHDRPTRASRLYSSAVRALRHTQDPSSIIPYARDLVIVSLDSTIRGSRIVNVDPRPGSLSTVMSPPII